MAPVSLRILRTAAPCASRSPATGAGAGPAPARRGRGRCGGAVPARRAGAAAGAARRPARARRRRPGRPLVDVVEHVVAGDPPAGAGAGDLVGVEAVLGDQAAHDRRQQPLSPSAAACGGPRAAAGSGRRRGRGRRRRGAGAGCGGAAAARLGAARGGRRLGLGAAGVGLGRRLGAAWRRGGCRRGAPPSPTTAITAPTGTVSPSWARISVSVPATGDGTSVSTLSVRHLEQRLVGGDGVADLLEPL